MYKFGGPITQNISCSSLEKSTCHWYSTYREHFKVHLLSNKINAHALFGLPLVRRKKKPQTINPDKVLGKNVDRPVNGKRQILDAAISGHLNSHTTPVWDNLANDRFVAYWLKAEASRSTWPTSPAYSTE